MALIEKRCRAQEFGSWSSITSLCTPFIILFHLFHFHLICMGLILSPCKPIEIVLAKLCFILIRLLWLRCIWSYSFFFCAVFVQFLWFSLFAFILRVNNQDAEEECKKRFFFSSTNAQTTKDHKAELAQQTAFVYRCRVMCMQTYDVLVI